MRESVGFGTATLSPIGVLGLQSNQLPLALDGYSDTFIARWDAEWNSHVFTSVDYQHQDLTNLSIPIPGLIDTIPPDRRQPRPRQRHGQCLAWTRFRRCSGRSPISNSQNETPGFDGPLPFVPEITGRVGLTWVNPANVKVTLAATYVGERDGDLAGTQLDDYWTGDAFLVWEPFDKRFELELAAYNIFDRGVRSCAEHPRLGPLLRRIAEGQVLMVPMRLRSGLDVNTITTSQSCGKQWQAARTGSRRRRSIALLVHRDVAALAAIAPTSPWKLIEARAFDYLSTFSPPKMAADSPVIVAVDEPSFAEIGLQWPWPRSLHGRLIEALRKAGAKAIGLDIIFAEPSSDPAADAALAAALGPDVTLAGDETLIKTPHADQTMRVEPLPEFLAAGAKVGHRFDRARQ